MLFKFREIDIRCFSWLEVGKNYLVCTHTKPLSSKWKRWLLAKNTGGRIFDTAALVTWMTGKWSGIVLTNRLGTLKCSGSATKVSGAGKLLFLCNWTIRCNSYLSRSCMLYVFLIFFKRNIVFGDCNKLCIQYTDYKHIMNEYKDVSPCNGFTFNMEIPIPWKDGLYLETEPWIHIDLNGPPCLHMIQEQLLTAAKRKLLRWMTS